MEKVLMTGRWARGVLFASALLLATACGDSGTYKLSTSDWGDSADEGHLWDLNGSTVELTRISSRCLSSSAQSLVAQVGSGMEFPGEAVTKLKSPCAAGPEVRVDIDLEGRSVLYDFSNVAESGVFPPAEIEGFVITDVFQSVAEIRSASLDRSVSSIELGDDALSFDSHSVSLNLAGVAFEPGTFVKVDLRFDTP